jgi:flagellar biosynthesis protein FliP
MPRLALGFLVAIASLVAASLANELTSKAAQTCGEKLSGQASFLVPTSCVSRTAQTSVERFASLFESHAWAQSGPVKPAQPNGGSNERVTGETPSGVPLTAIPGKNAGSPLFSLNIANSESPDDLVPALRVVAILTILTFAPAILLLMSAFTRIMIVLSFLRQALGAPTMPPNQVLVGLSLFLTYFVMAPTTTKMYEQAIKPYMEKTISAEMAFDKGIEPVRNFMLSQARKEDMGLFFQLSKEPQPKSVADVPLRVLIPAFVIGELKAAFQIGFLVYLPFIVIDMIVSSVLMAMGMMMLPPTVVSLPLKIILFVLVDGWNLLAGSLVRSFA